MVDTYELHSYLAAHQVPRQFFSFPKVTTLLDTYSFIFSNNVLYKKIYR